MRSYYQTERDRFFSGALPPGIKVLLIINVAVFLLQFLSRIVGIPMELFLGLSRLAVEKGLIFQVFTYMWLHSTGQIMHILFNMLGLWMFGRELEITWGTRQFIKYYLVSGVGAGIFILLLDLFFGQRFAITIGASGALYGVLLASAMSWPNREVYLYFLFPIKMKYFVTAFGVISFLGILGDTSGNISHAGHLGGIVAGFLYIQYKRRNWSKIFKFNFGSDRDVNRISDAKIISIKDYKKSKSDSYASRTFDERKRKVDDLLDRISREGLNSLSEEEKKFLNDASRSYEKGQDDSETRH